MRFICYLRLYGHFLVEKVVGLKYLRICNYSREAVFFKPHTFYLTVVTLMIFLRVFYYLIPLPKLLDQLGSTSNYLEPGWSIVITIHF